MPHASFDGLRVLSLESRRAREVEKLIQTYGGDPLVVPVMREIPLSSNAVCLEFGRRLLAGEFDLIVFLTGVGVSKMMEILATQFDMQAVLDALRRCEIVVRGIKPLGVLRELKVPSAVVTPEPSTWREVLAEMDKVYGNRLSSMSIAVQEYGATNPELIAELVQRSGSVTKVPVYQWGLPTDLEPLHACIREMIDGEIDVVLFMTAVQAIHLFQVASEMNLADELREALNSIAVVSVGPTTTEELLHYHVQPDFEPSRPRMGYVVNEAAQYAGKVLAAKRTPKPPSDMSSDNSGNSTAAGTSKSKVVPQPVVGRPYVQQVAPSTSTMAGFRDGLASLDILQEISGSFATSDPLHVVLARIVACVSAIVPCDSCFLYTLEDDKLILRASRNPHSAELDQLNMAVGQGVTGWVASIASQLRSPIMPARIRGSAFS